MSRHLATLARRRPGLVLLAALYAVTTVLVARSPLTVALCSVLLVSVLVQVGFGLRDRPSEPVTEPS